MGAVVTNLFARPNSNYVVGEDILDAILADDANPLGNIAAIINQGSSVLDIGAGNGLLGRVLARAGKDVAIDAIEPNPFAASLIPTCYRQVYQGYLQEFHDQIRARNYDYIVMADVIEHFADPQPVLQELLKCLKPDVKLLISLPNVAFGGVRLSLMRGNFVYTDSGILERTHLRFYTLELARQLFAKLDLSEHAIYFLQRRFTHTEFNSDVRSAGFINRVRLAFDPTARAYQYLFIVGYGRLPKSSVVKRGEGCYGAVVDATLFGRAIDRLFRKLLTIRSRFK
ncbi:MAG TPA: hypothetical protein DHV59_14700 [Oxalobacteraceae bacterium]|nr:hypothetical protein [Oxalobacteraceae bacterium]